MQEIPQNNSKYGQDKWPSISCWCPTFAREELLEEAIYSFITQDYPGQKELLIINDYEKQELIFDHPEVKIFNYKKRFNSLSEKFHHCIELCSNEYIAPWAADDICFPWRLRISIDRMNVAMPLPHMKNHDKNHHFYAPNGWITCWYNEQGNINWEFKRAYDHGAVLYSRKIWDLVKDDFIGLNYHSAIGPEIENKFRILGYWTFDRDIPVDEVFYVYRRFPYKESWYNLGKLYWKFISHNQDSTGLAKAQELLARDAQKGTIELNPHWNMDYTDLLKMSDGKIELRVASL